tara:strand:+ start:52604 stop:53404 length:801 start_codon:yes stop_codon:yes gene_type:complete
MSPLKWWRVCQTCNKYYQEINNIGTWNCKYHCGTYNADYKGTKFPKYSYECCGASPVAYNDDGSRNPYFNPGLMNGCTAKDCSAHHKYFSDIDRIYEKDFPAELLQELKDDIQKLTSDQSIKQQIVFKHKGLNIDASTGVLYIDRKDFYAEQWRNKNKVLFNKNLTKTIEFVIDQVIRRNNGYEYYNNNSSKRRRQTIRINDTDDFQVHLQRGGPILKARKKYIFFDKEISLPLKNNEAEKLRLHEGYETVLKYKNTKPFYYVLEI